MEFLGGALPNVMFIIGILAIGLGLGIELKLVALNKEIDKTGRIGAIIVGVLLVAASLFIYLNPALTNRNQASSAPTTATSTPASLASTAAPAAAAIAAPAEASTAEAPTAVAVPTATLVPTDMPTATPVPTSVPPTVMAVPMVKVPDLHDQDDKAAQRKLKDAGLTPKKVDTCNGADQGERNVKKGRVQCQDPAAESDVPLGTTVEYVIR
jgi:hypothetical protein